MTWHYHGNKYRTIVEIYLSFSVTRLLRNIVFSSSRSWIRMWLDSNCCSMSKSTSPEPWRDKAHIIVSVFCIYELGCEVVSI